MNTNKWRINSSGTNHIKILGSKEKTCKECHPQISSDWQIQKEVLCNHHHIQFPVQTL